MTTTHTHNEIKTMNTTTTKGANDAFEALKARLAEQGEQVNNTSASRTRRSSLWIDSAQGNNTFAEAVLVLAMEHVEYKSARVAVGGGWQKVTPSNFNDLKDNEVRVLNFTRHCMMCDEDDYTDIQISVEGDYYVAHGEVRMRACLTPYNGYVEHETEVDAIVRYCEGKNLVDVIKTVLDKIRHNSKDVRIMTMAPVV